MAAETGAPSVLVSVAPLKAGSLPRAVTAWGSMLSPPSATQVISARTSETVSAVHVHAGEDVPAGAPLLQLVPDAQTAASYSVAQSTLRDAERALARTRDMLAQHLATAQQLDAARKARSDAQAALEALKAQGAAGVSTVRAPFHAIVTKVSVARGALVAAGAALLEIAKAEDLTLRVNVTPSQARLVAPGNPAQVASLDGLHRVTGKVARRGASIDPGTGLVPIDITVPANPLFAGENAQAVITVGQTEGYLVPHAAILVNPEGKPYVVQIEGGKARRVAVEVLGAQGDENVIRGTELKADQPLVLSGNYQAGDGMAVRLTDKAANDTTASGR
ncbi:MAG TPA: efflux RND transporter periplasmic adaptor subunit [Ottowia sp.]|nr:efflux RND transporter periplasmic adaptor subunit [Ottowia sp.]